MIFGKFSYRKISLFNVTFFFPPRTLESFKESLDALVEMGTFLQNVKAIKKSKEERAKERENPMISGINHQEEKRWKTKSQRVFIMRM